MRGKGVPKMGSIFGFFLQCFGFGVGCRMVFGVFIIFGFNFGFYFIGVLDFLGVFWEPSSVS